MGKKLHHFVQPLPHLALHVKRAACLPGKKEDKIMAEKPGIILYFDMFHPLKPLSYEEKGRLLEAMMEYGEYGVLPELEGILELAWGYLKPRMDVDARKYRRKVARSLYGGYCAAEHRAGREPLPMEEWLTQEGFAEEYCPEP